MTPDDTNDPRTTDDPVDAQDTRATRSLPLDEPTVPGSGPPSGPEAEDVDDDPQRRSGRHPLSIGYLVSGLIFLGVAASWGLREAGVVDAGSSSWLFPLTLVVVGAIGLAASVVSSARRP